MVRQGHGRVVLNGRKLKGGWTLHRTRGQGTRSQWLFIKRRDGLEDPTRDVTHEDRSVFSGLRIEDLQVGVQPPENPYASLRPTAAGVLGARLADFPQPFEPMLPTLTKEVFQRSDWLYEPKLDGFRVLAYARDGQVQLRSRGGQAYEVPVLCQGCLSYSAQPPSPAIAAGGSRYRVAMRTAALGSGYFVVPEGAGPHPGVVVIHEAYGLNDNIRDICRRLAEQGYATLGVDLFAGRSRALCMARMLSSWLSGNLNDSGVTELKAALDQLSQQPEVDPERLGAIGFCMGGFYATTWACTDDRLKVIAPYYGNTPRRKAALRRLCPVVGSWPAKDFTSGAATTLEIALTAAGVAHDLKVYPGAKHSFFNDQSANYHPTAAADSWERVLVFFREHLTGG